MRITALVVGTVGVGSAMVGGWGWAFAIAAWTIAVFLMLHQPSPVRDLARRLDAKADEGEMQSGQSAYRVQWGVPGGGGPQSSVFESLESASEMAERLVELSRSSEQALVSMASSEDGIICFESVIWPGIGPIPSRVLLWVPEEAKWVERWPGMGARPAVGFVAAFERQRTEQAMIQAAAQSQPQATRIGSGG